MSADANNPTEQLISVNTEDRSVHDMMRFLMKDIFHTNSIISVTYQVINTSRSRSLYLASTTLCTGATNNQRKRIRFREHKKYLY